MLTKKLPKFGSKCDFWIALNNKMKKYNEKATYYKRLCGRRIITV